MCYDTLNEYVQYLQSFPRTRPKDVLTLDRMKLVLDELGHPERGLTGIHVAGTNGKGSTVAVSERVLREAGFITGSYFSPHLLTYTERIQVNGQSISKRDLVMYIDLLKPIVHRVEKKIDDRLTWFELLSVVAVLYFKDRKVDVVIWEVGLGGTFDPGNLLDLHVKVITNVQRDHLQVLGPTLDHVASEKAGIITSKEDVVITGVEGRLYDVIMARAERFGAEIIHVLEDIDVVISEVSFEGTLLSLCGSPEFRMSLVGSHFAMNAALACRAAKQIVPDLSFETVRNALKDIVIPGRFQVVGHRPTTILDIAHNPDGTERLMETMNDLGISRDQLAILYAGKKRKKAADVLKILNTRSRHIIFTNQKGFHDPYVLSRLVDNSEVAASIPRALKAARSRVGSGGTVLVTGSSFFVGEVLAFLHGLERNSLDRVDDNIVEQLQQPLQVEKNVV